MKRGAIALLTALMLVSLLPGLTVAASVLDQHSEDTSYGWGGNVTATYGQTFTVGMTGSLTGIALSVDAVSVATTVDVKIEALGGTGFPNGTALTSGSAAVPTTSGWVSVSLTPYSVTSGQVYAIVFTMNAQPNGQWEVWGSLANPYANGEAQDGNNGWSALQNVTTSDFAFRTYVDAAASSPSASATATQCVVGDLNPAAFSTPRSCPTPFQSLQGATATAGHSATPPPTSTGPDGSTNDSTPLFALMICLAFGGLGLAALAAQRRSLRN
jgi:hypothetical protein